MSYLEPILVHSVRRQNFRDTVAQKCNPYLIRCHKQILWPFQKLLKNNRSSRYILWKKLSSSLGCTVLGIFYIFYTFYTSFETLLYFFGTLAARLFDLNVSSGESFSFSLSCSICSRPCQAHNESLFLIFASLFSDTLVMQYLRSPEKNISFF